MGTYKAVYSISVIQQLTIVLFVVAFLLSYLFVWVGGLVGVGGGEGGDVVSGSG